MAESTVTTPKTHAEIPFGVIEYTVQLKQPLFEAWRDAASLIRVVLLKLEPFGFKIDGVEIKTPEKLSERVIIFRRSANPSFIFNVGVAKVWAYAENLDWSEAHQAVSCIDAGLAAVFEMSKYEVALQQLVLGMHVQTKDKSISEVTSSLLAPPALGLLDGNVRCHGVILVRDKATLVLDASAAFANGFFVKITREHPPERSLKEIAETLLNDEKALFDTLGLEGDL